MLSNHRNQIFPRCIALLWRFLILLAGVAVLGHPALLSAKPGDLDFYFNADASKPVLFMAQQPDGKILVGYNETFLKAGESPIARLNSDGTVDVGFKPAAHGKAGCILVQQDGRILVGGSFKAEGGAPGGGLIRLLADGARDPDFTTGSSGTTSSLVVLSDGKILAGGSMTFGHGSTRRSTLARLNADGTLDPEFNAGPFQSSKTASVTGIAIQPDGMILVAGMFGMVNGADRKSVARLYPDGALDSAFNPAVPLVQDYGRICLFLDSNGKILIGGGFQPESEPQTGNLRRLLPDGTEDPSFNPDVPAGWVNSLAMRSDGKILVGIDYDGTGETKDHRVVRLNDDGGRDSTFVARALNPPYSISALTIQSDGQLLASGLAVKNGHKDYFLQRLESDPATQTLSAPTFNKVRWQGGGGTPETVAVYFDFSTNNGLTWRRHGRGAGINGGWELSGPSLPESGLLRAQPAAGGGQSTGLAEAIIPFSGFAVPEIAVEGNGREISSGDESPNEADHRDFGPVDVREGTLTRTFTIRNRGAGPLELPETPVVRLEGRDASDFTVISVPSSSIEPGNETSFSVSFSPRTLGVRQAIISMASWDADERTYKFAVQGTGVGLVPEVAVFGNGVEIASGDTTPAAEDHTDFGKTASVGGTFVGTFTIRNNGTAPLKPVDGGPLISITGPHAADFTITSPAADAVPAGGDAVLQVLFSPSAPGLRQATIRISSDDEDEGEFLFAVQGSGRFPGEAQLEFPFVGRGDIYAMAVQADGGILIGRDGYYISRLKPDGTEDTSFQASAPARAIVVQPDGRSLITGNFSSVNAFPAQGIARLLPDGTVDKTFQSEARLSSGCLAVQPDGKILLGGSLTVGGVTRHLVRLNASGKLDPAFKNDHDIRYVSSLTVLENGGIMICGSFTTVSGTPEKFVARLQADGTLDPEFNASPNGSNIACMVEQPDGKMIIGGPFTSVNNISCNGIARLLPDGSVDGDYLGNTGPSITSMALQTDGGLVITGAFTGIDGQPRDGVARLTVNGVLDGNFTPQALIDAERVLVQGDGRILLGGAYDYDHGVMSRLENAPASHSLTVTGYNRMRWLRGGTSPEASAVVFEASGDEGKTWQALGRGQRIDGGWELNGPGLPAAGLLRASAWMVTSPGDGAGGIAAETVAFSGMVPPAISVTGNGVEIKNGDNAPDTASHRDFGPTAVRGGVASRVFTIHSTGRVPLNLLGNLPITVSGPDAAAFSVETPEPRTIAPGGSLTFEVFFDPAALGLRTAVIHIASDDFSGADFAFAVQGTGSDLAPEIAIAGNGSEISNGDITPSLTDHTDFGSSRSADGKVMRSFTILNTGTTDLILAGVRLSGAQASDFTVTSPPPQSVPVNGQAVVQITFYPSAAGMRKAVIEVSSDDDDEPLFSFAIQGTGWAPGDLDPDFQAYPNSIVSSLGLQPDGKILIGGHFSSVAQRTGTNPSSLREVPRDCFARLNNDGTLDTTLNVTFDTFSSNSCLVRLPDGRLLVGGYISPPSGTSGYPLVRLNADDTIDKTFLPAMDGYCRSVVLMPDGKMVIGGEFTTVNGVARAGLARLNTDGSLDTTFDPKATRYVYSVQQQRDGKILLGGDFGSVAGVTRNHIARLNADGSLDTAFNPSISSEVRCLALQPDGKILVGGGFNGVGTVTRANLARLNPDGTLDTAFNPKPDGTVLSMALQTDGKVVVAGEFTKVGTVTRSRLARLNPDGTLDPDFDPAANDFVRGVVLDPMGRILIGGAFTTVDGTARANVARLENDPAPQQIQVIDGSQVRWLRGGSSAETQEVSFDLSTDGAVTWIPLGQGSRITGGWELSGLDLPSTGKIRGRARIEGGYHNSSSSLVETVAEISGEDIPQMTVERPRGSVLKNGAHKIDFGSLLVGNTSKPQVLTVINRGSQPLNVEGITLDGPHKGDFILRGVPATPFSLPGWSSLMFEVLFHPQSGGGREAIVKISSNAGEGMDPFLVGLSGKANTPPVFTGYVLQASKDTPAAVDRLTLKSHAMDPEGNDITLSSHDYYSSLAGGTVVWSEGSVTYHPPSGLHRAGPVSDHPEGFSRCLYGGLGYRARGGPQRSAPGKHFGTGAVRLRPCQSSVSWCSGPILSDSKKPGSRFMVRPRHPRC